MPVDHLPESVTHFLPCRHIVRLPLRHRLARAREPALGEKHITMVVEVVSSMMGDRSDRRFPNLICTKALEAVQLIRRRRADFHQVQEQSSTRLAKVGYMAATDGTRRRF